MAVKIRLTRIGKKRQPSYRVVVADARSPRDGAYIEQIGRYDPRQEPSVVEIDNERASYWIDHGAQPSSQVKKLLEISGALAARPIRESRIHVIGETAQPEAAAAPVSAAIVEVIDEVGEAAGVEAVEMAPANTAAEAVVDDVVAAIDDVAAVSDEPTAEEEA
ncbi:MAG: 30S ribosomal protein S16 [Actinobacteria bacterium RBG_16_68_21]|nr:MAG: 30S ribosomal protein S16 [Actinobacteria bacterium RBG_16_68_21]